MGGGLKQCKALALREPDDQTPQSVPGSQRGGIVHTLPLCAHVSMSVNLR